MWVEVISSRTSSSFYPTSYPSASCSRLLSSVPLLHLPLALEASPVLLLLQGVSVSLAHLRQTPERSRQTAARRQLPSSQSSLTFFSPGSRAILSTPERRNGVDRSGQRCGGLVSSTLRFCKERHDAPGETAYALPGLALDGSPLTKSAT